VPNSLVPIYHELCGKIWGIIGYGNIGKAVGKIADAFGCKVIVNKRTPVTECECVSIDELISRADIISIHCPLNENTRNLIDVRELSMMKKDAILVNVARGGVWNEEAVANAILNGTIGAMGCDVFTKEPFDESHPFYKIKDFDNVLLTPHMAWGSFESRTRCYSTVISNIEAYLKGEPTNIVN
jgi:glycerate dehydrogenase